jgi:hypothetical protein
MLNQWAATNKRIYGNRGAENWYRVKRVLEENMFDITGLSQETREQLSSRQYKQQGLGGRIYLESKKDAKACGRNSPDRADAFILTFCGLNLDDFLDGRIEHKDDTLRASSKRFKMDELYEQWDEITFNEKRSTKEKRIFGSLTLAMEE